MHRRRRHRLPLFALLLFALGSSTAVTIAPTYFWVDGYFVEAVGIAHVLVGARVASEAEAAAQGTARRAADQRRLPSRFARRAPIRDFGTATTRARRAAALAAEQPLPRCSTSIATAL